MPSIRELTTALDQKRGEMAAIFDKHRTPEGEYDMPTDVLTEVRGRNEELDRLGADWEQAREILELERRNSEQLERLRTPVRPPMPVGAGAQGFAGEGRRQKADGGGPPGWWSYGGDPVAEKTLGDLWCEGRAYGRIRAGERPPTGSAIGEDIPEFSLKTLMSTTAGWAPFSPRVARWIPSAQRTPVIADYIPTSEVGPVGSILYMEETGFTNAAAAVAEGGTKPESAESWTEQTSPIRKIATWIPVTDEQISDVPQIRGIIDNRLTLMLMLTEESQILTGNGTAPNLRGLNSATGIQTQAKGSDPTPDAVFKAMTLVRFTGHAEPSLMVAHPNDWQDVRLLRTADGVYIWGNASDPGPERMWGVPVLVTSAQTENQFLIGDFLKFSHISRRAGINIEVSNSHSTYFIENKLAIRAEERLSLEIFRGAAFCKVTGV